MRKSIARGQEANCLYKTFNGLWSYSTNQVATDASAYGRVAMISPRIPVGTERPIAFASHTLTAGKKNYAHLEREALSLISGVKKFHWYMYLYSWKFTLLTDHQHLLLSVYDYDISFKHSKEHGNADGLSRLPLPSSQPTVGEEGVTVFDVGQIQSLRLTFQDIKLATNMMLLWAGYLTI